MELPGKTNYYDGQLIEKFLHPQKILSIDYQLFLLLLGYFILLHGTEIFELGDISPLFYCRKMLSKDTILELISDKVAEKELFIVSLNISTSNNVKLVVDSMKGIGIKDCVDLSRAIEHNLDRDTEDFELEVSSAGLNEPFKVREQYEKNIGREVEVISEDGRKEKGTLIRADEAGFCIEQEKRVKVEGRKKKQKITNILEYTYDERNKVRVVIKF
jgi:ribosome maturation factor RimP